MIDEISQLHTLEQAAAKLGGVKERTLKEAIYAGKGPVFHIAPAFIQGRVAGELVQE